MLRGVTWGGPGRVQTRGHSWLLFSSPLVSTSLSFCFIFWDIFSILSSNSSTEFFLFLISYFTFQDFFFTLNSSLFFGPPPYSIFFNKVSSLSPEGSGVVVLKFSCPCIISVSSRSILFPVSLVGSLSHYRFSSHNWLLSALQQHLLHQEPLESWHMSTVYLDSYITYLVLLSIHASEIHRLQIGLPQATLDNQAHSSKSIPGTSLLLASTISLCARSSVTHMFKKWF